MLIWLNYSSPGILQLHPGAINSIPSKSHLEIGRCLCPFKNIRLFRKIWWFSNYQSHGILVTDVRDIDEKRRNDVIEKIRRAATEISKNRGVVLSEFKIINQDPPALSDQSVVEAMEFAAKQLNLEYKKMISRAYHDSLFMARWITSPNCDVFHFWIFLVHCFRSPC